MFWYKLFKKKEKSTDVVNSFSINKLDYDNLTDDEKEYVNEIIKEYITFFDSNSDVSKLDIDIINEIIMYQDLGLNIMYNEHLGNIIGSIVDSKKLAYYSHKIDELNNILKYKHLALNILRKDKKYLTKHMGLYVLGKSSINVIRALDNQINIINNLLVVTNKSIYDYNSFVLANMPNIDNVDIKKELMELYEQVKEDYQKLFNVEPYFEKELSIVDKIVYLELFIDKFIYENKDLVGKLKEKLDIISNSEIKDKEEQKDIIDNLMKIKMYYIIFDRYGRNKISKEEFHELYQIIFNVYTYYPCDTKFPFYYYSLTNEQEEKYYEKIIEYKIDLLKMKKSLIFNCDRKYSDNVYKTVLDIIDIEEKHSDQFPDPRYTRSSIIRRTISNYLPLLLSLDYENGFDMYFDSVNPQMILLGNKFIECNEMFKKFEYYKYIVGMVDKKERIERITPGRADELKLFYYLYHDKLDYSVLPDLISGYNLSNLYSSEYNYYLKFSGVDKVYIPSGTKTLGINLYNINIRSIIINENASNLTLYLDYLNYNTQTIKPNISIYLPNKSISINVDLNDGINYLDQNKKEFLDLLGIFLSNILSTIVLPTDLYLKNTAEIENYLSETFLGVYNYLSKMIVDNQISTSYDILFYLFLSILQNVNIYSGNHKGELLMSISEMIDFFDNKKYNKTVFKNKGVSDDSSSQNINPEIDADKIVYRAYINAIKYVAFFIKKENYFHYNNNNIKIKNDLKNYIFNY